MYTLSRLAHDDDYDHNIHHDKHHSVQAENPRFGKRDREGEREHINIDPIDIKAKQLLMDKLLHQLEYFFQ